MNKGNKRAWAYPVTDWKIQFYFTQSGKEWCDDFYNISSLTTYFAGVPERGILIGFGIDLPQHRTRQSFLPCTGGKLTLWYLESGQETSLDFINFDTFVKYLNENPNIARALSYKGAI
jgi:hypothetical protein